MRLEIDESRWIDIHSADDIAKHLDISKICTLQKKSGYFVQWFVEDGECSISRRYGTGDTHFFADVETFDPADLLAIFQSFYANDTSWHDRYELDWERGPEIGDSDVEYEDLGEFEPE